MPKINDDVDWKQIFEWWKEEGEIKETPLTLDKIARDFAAFYEFELENLQRLAKNNKGQALQDFLSLMGFVTAAKQTASASPRSPSNQGQKANSLLNQAVSRHLNSVAQLANVFLVDQLSIGVSISIMGSIDITFTWDMPNFPTQKLQSSSKNIYKRP